MSPILSNPVNQWCWEQAVVLEKVQRGSATNSTLFLFHEYYILALAEA